jgi:hypothetical protein
VHVTPTVLQAETTAIVANDEDPAPGAVPIEQPKPGDDEILKHGYDSVKKIVP